jgi:cytochrome P450
VPQRRWHAACHIRLVDRAGYHDIGGKLVSSIGAERGAFDSEARAATAGETIPTTGRGSLPRATLLDTLGAIAGVVIPTLAKGVIIRRPPMVALAERLDLDARAVRLMQQLRDRYGSGPLLLRIPVRSQAVILSPEHVRRVLDETPEPFATASLEKQAALAHFQPRGVLISHGGERADRRRFNEQVLDSERPAHRHAERFTSVVREEADTLVAMGERHGELTWDDFAGTWFRVVRRIVFGDAARDDHQLTDMVAQLRHDANWAFLRPRRTWLRKKFFRRMKGYLDRPEPDSLAAVMAGTHKTGVTEPMHQVPQWLFAFDPAGMTTFRTLALLASHPEQAERARQEIEGRQGPGRHDMPFLRACVLESLRLWPTTPMILRESTRQTTWDAGVMPARTGVAIFAPFFHRDDTRLPYAHRFEPELWLGKEATEDWPLVPFSGGPGQCPGQNLVLLLSSNMLAELLDGRQIRLKPPARLDARRPLPGTLNNYSLRFEIGG